VIKHKDNARKFTSICSSVSAVMTVSAAGGGGDLDDESSAVGDRQGLDGASVGGMSAAFAGDSTP